MSNNTARGDADGLAAGILTQIDTLATTISRRHLDAHPSLRARYPDTAEQRCAEDTAHHLRHLAAALSTGRDELFTGYVRWAADLMTGLGMATDDLASHLDTTAEVLDEVFDGTADAIACIERAHNEAGGETAKETSFLDTATTGRTAALARDFLAALLAGQRADAIRMIIDAADDGLDLETIYLEVFQPCLREVGRLWQTRRISVAQEHLVTAATQVAMAQLYPRVFATERNGHSAVVVSVGGELHELGGRMVADIFELRGWTTHFTGADTPTRALIELVERTGAELVAISATIGAHVPTVAATIAALRRLGDLTILVGGRPFLELPDLWRSIGADGTAIDAVRAVDVAHDLLDAA